MEGFDDSFPQHKEGKVAGAYVIIHPHTEKMYVGSSGDLVERKYHHESDLRLGKHVNEQLQQAYNMSPELVFKVQRTPSKDEALALEQSVLNAQLPSGKLFNLANDAAIPTKGRTVTSEQRQHLSSIQKGRRNSEDTIKKMELAQQKYSTSVSVDGVVYPSAGAAGRAIGVKPSTVRSRILSNNPEFKEWKYS